MRRKVFAWVTGSDSRHLLILEYGQGAEETQHLRLEFQKLAAPFPRRNLANLANDGVVLLRKCREQKLAIKLHFCDFAFDNVLGRVWIGLLNVIICCLYGLKNVILFCYTFSCEVQYGT